MSYTLSVREYQRPNDYKYGLNEWEMEHFKNAILYAITSGYYGDSRLLDEDDFVIIQVNGYDCIAAIIDDYLPIEINNLVIPFDINSGKVYPVQTIERRFNFKQ